MTPLEMTLIGGGVSILVGVITHAVTKSSENKKLDDHKEIEEKREDVLADILKEMKDELITVGKNMTAVETTIRTYDNLWTDHLALRKEFDGYKLTIAKEIADVREMVLEQPVRQTVRRAPTKKKTRN